MLYLCLDKNTIKLISLRKTLLGQQETSFFEKQYETNLIEKGLVANVDLLASAIKEALSSSSDKSITQDQVVLVLPQEAFYFLRTQVPSDIAPSALNSFISDKARASFPISLDDCLTSTFVRDTDREKMITLFGISKDVFENYQNSLSLIDLKIKTIIPEAMAYFKLFEKTLRNEKKENIFYLTLGKNGASGYLFDSYGLIDDKKISFTTSPDHKIQELIKDKVLELGSKNLKLNRIILSGEPSEKIRQDTFTKEVGVWTNPLKRIAPTFYDEYLKQLVVEEKKAFPLLTYDICFGAFIFATENKDFTFFKNGFKSTTKKPLALPHVGMPKKEIFIFIGSFALSFLLFVLISKAKLPEFGKISLVSKPTPTVAPTEAPTPTPAFKKEDLKIQLLNGGGVKGKAIDVKDILKNKGYGEIITSNADNFDYLITEVKVKKEFATIIPTLKTDLKDYLSSFKELELPATSTADLVIIIGQDFK